MKKKAISKAVKSSIDRLEKEKSRKQFADSVLAVQPADTSNALVVESNDGNGNDGDNATQNLPPLPTPEQLGITISTGFAGDTLKVSSGDTINFPVTISWDASIGSLLVVPASSANTMDLVQLGVSQESSRMVKDGREIAQITFNYKLIAKDYGDLLIPPLRFDIPTATGQTLNLKSDPVPVHAEPKSGSLIIVILVVVALAWVIGIVRRVRRKAKAKKQLEKWKDALGAIRERMLVLKQRVNVADSREWLLELESICKEFVALRFHAKDASTINLDNLVKAGSLEGWEHLVEEFAHARYGGGIRDSFENKETWKLAMSLMELEEEE